jgi:hypothetical protein
MNNSPANETLPFLSSQERLEAYQFIVDGCSHIWSKGEMQTPKALAALQRLLPLSQKDPYFLAQLTSYVMRKSMHKDLQVFTAYANSLNSANGTPFSPGSKYMKPNLRVVSAAAVQMMDPKIASRVLEVAEMKYAIPELLNESRHFSTTLRTALEKYLKYREANIHILKGIKKAGMTGYLKYMYTGLHLSRSPQSAAIMRWREKGKDTKFEDTIFNFKDLTDLQIAEKIQKEKLPVLSALSALPRKLSPVIAVALLEQATGNQAVILRTAFEDAGVLKDEEVMKLYEEKIKTAKTALDRVDTIAQNASQAVKDVMVKARAESRQAETAGLGKVFIHLDISTSMNRALEVAKDRGSIFAEMVNNPTENFRWGVFSSNGGILPLPQEFVRDAFASILFPITCGGMTDAFALYDTARKAGSDIDVFISDGGHNTGDLEDKIRHYHRTHPAMVKPKVMIWVMTAGDGGGIADTIKRAYEENGIPVVSMHPDTLTESALVVQAVKSAMVGPTGIIDEIMSTELLKLPEWYYTI